MDWAKKEVASLELSKRLKELGFPQNREGWYWIKTTYPVKWILAIMLDGIWLSVKNYIIIKDEVIEEIVKAPTNSELGKWLPEGFHEFKLDNRFWIKDKQDYNYLVNDDIEVNARAKMAIWLRENGYITFNQGDTNAQPRQQA